MDHDSVLGLMILVMAGLPWAWVMRRIAVRIRGEGPRVLLRRRAYLLGARRRLSSGPAAVLTALVLAGAMSLGGLLILAPRQLRTLTVIGKYVPRSHAGNAYGIETDWGVYDAERSLFRRLRVGSTYRCRVLVLLTDLESCTLLTTVNATS